MNTLPLSVPFSCLPLLLCFVATVAEAEQHWSRFRGPNGSGNDDSMAIPADPMQHIAWRASIDGIGHSSPILWGKNLYVQSADNSTQKQFLFCINAATGKELWKKSFDYQSYRIHNRNSHGSGTPTADATGVYTTWGSAEDIHITKFSHKGEKLWQKDLGGYQCNHGPALAPIVFDNLVICPLLEEPPRDGKPNREIRARILAFQSATGEKAWEVTKNNGKASFCVPCVYEKSGERQLVFCNTADGMFALNPETGDELWSHSAFDLRTVSSTVVADDLLIGTNGSGGGGNYLVAIRPGKEPQEIYRVRKQAPYVPTPVHKNQMLFLWSDRGIATCIAADTGKELWRHRVGDSSSASPVCIGNQFVGITDSGDVHVFEAQPRLKLVTKFSLGETTRATPATGNGHIFFRTERELIAVRGVAK